MSNEELRRVLPGGYEVRMTAAGDALRRTVEVLDGRGERTPGRIGRGCLRLDPDTGPR